MRDGKIQQAKKAIEEFLKAIEIKVDKDFVKNLPEPHIEEDEVLGKIFKFEIDKIRFEVTEEPLRVSSFSNSDFSRVLATNLVKGLYSGEVEKEYSEKEAEQKAVNIESKLIPRFNERNFVLDKLHSSFDPAFKFQWNEFPKGKVISVVNNFIYIELDKKTLDVIRLSIFEFDYPRTEPPKISKEEAVEIAKKEWGNKGELGYVDLVNQVSRGKSTKTVWTVKLKFKNPICDSHPIHLIIDADTGEILQGKEQTERK